MSSRKFFALFLLCAVIPLAAAKLSLEMGWFDHSNNKGNWLAHEIHLLPESAARERWRLVYVQADDCDSHCDHALTIMQQLYVGLGRKQANMKPLILAAKSPATLDRFPAINWQQDVISPSKLPNKNELHNHIVIVNQQGLVLLRYPVADDVEEMQTTAKAIRSDLLRLMNYDRGGA
jgi:hypothetical protein